MKRGRYIEGVVTAHLLLASWQNCASSLNPALHYAPHPVPQPETSGVLGIHAPTENKLATIRLHLEIHLKKNGAKTLFTNMWW